MSDLGYLSAKRERQLARILDASIDFDVLLKGKKKFLGVINVGSVLERNDRTLFRIMIAYLDDNILGENAKPEQIEVIEKAITLLENHDFSGFIDYVSNLIIEGIDVSFVSNNKILFIGILQTLSGIVSKVVAKIDELNEKADQESKD